MHDYPFCIMADIANICSMVLLVSVHDTSLLKAGVKETILMQTVL